MSPKLLLKRVWRSRRLRRALCWSLISAALFSLLATTAFLIAAHYAQRNFRPVNATLSPELRSAIDGIEGYRRDEDATYLTFPEWYLVFNPQDYGQFLSENRPSGFPYFTSIAQIWGGYTEVYGISEKHYDFNPGYNLMLCVIGVSSTVELAIDYGAFIPTTPWFEFPFGKTFTELWTTTDFFGPNFIRKTERKCFLSLEYAVKTVYAAIIRSASQSVYGVADTEVYLTARHIGQLSLARPNVRPVQQLDEDLWIITVPHYQGFTDTLPLLARDGVDFEEIAGNDEIMLTLVAPDDWTYDLSSGQPLFTMPMLADPQARRHAVQVPVHDLGVVLRELQAKDLRLEHLFDY